MRVARREGDQPGDVDVRVRRSAAVDKGSGRGEVRGLVMQPLAPRVIFVHPPIDRADGLQVGGQCNSLGPEHPQRCGDGQRTACDAHVHLPGALGLHAGEDDCASVQRHHGGVAGATTRVADQCHRALDAHFQHFHRDPDGGAGDDGRVQHLRRPARVCKEPHGAVVDDEDLGRRVDRHALAASDHTVVCHAEWCLCEVDNVLHAHNLHRRAARHGRLLDADAQREQQLVCGAALVARGLAVLPPRQHRVDFVAAVRVGFGRGEDGLSTTAREFGEVIVDDKLEPFPELDQNTGRLEVGMELGPHLDVKFLLREQVLGRKRCVQRVLDTAANRGRRCFEHDGPQRPDRVGRFVGQLELDDHRFVRADLVKDGLHVEGEGARASTRRGNREPAHHRRQPEGFGEHVHSRVRDLCSEGAPVAHLERHLHQGLVREDGAGPQHGCDQGGHRQRHAHFQLVRPDRRRGDERGYDARLQHPADNEGSC